jgi:hypothetical protein
MDNLPPVHAALRLGFKEAMHPEAQNNAFLYYTELLYYELFSILKSGSPESSNGCVKLWWPKASLLDRDPGLP